MTQRPLVRRLGRRLWGGVAVLLVTAAFILHGLLWFIVTGRMEAEWPNAVAAAAGEGWRIDAGPLRRAGWPWRATIEAPGLVATRMVGDVALRWTFERADISLEPTAPRTLLISASGPQTIEFGIAPPIQITAGQATLATPLLDRSAPSVLTVRALVMADSVRVGSALVTLTPTPERDNLQAEMHGVMLGQPASAPFDQGAEFTLRSFLIPPPAQASSPARSAELWRAAGGYAQVEAFVIAWGSARAEGSARVALDAGLQPVAEGLVTIQGAADALDAGQHAGLVAAGPVSAAKAVLRLLALARGGPGPVPFTFRGGTLTVAQFRLIRLPPIDWGPP